MMPPPLPNGEQWAYFSLPIQTLASSGNILTDTHRIIFTYILGNPLSQQVVHEVDHHNQHDWQLSRPPISASLGLNDDNRDIGHSHQPTYHRHVTWARNQCWLHLVSNVITILSLSILPQRNISKMGSLSLMETTCEICKAVLPQFLKFLQLLIGGLQIHILKPCFTPGSPFCVCLAWLTLLDVSKKNFKVMSEVNSWMALRHLQFSTIC